MFGWRGKRRRTSLVFLLAGVLGCVSGAIRQVTVTNEFPQDLSKELKDKFEIRESSGESRSISSENPAQNAAMTQDDEVGKKGKKKKKKRRNAQKGEPEKSFVYPSRRPQKDPIWVSEHLVYSIRYFGVSAGDLILDVLPFKEVNRRKVYHIRANAISSTMFSLFYRLNDIVESFMDYEGSFSHRFHLVLDETKQTRDALELNDSEKQQTFYWNRWHHNVKDYTESKEFGHIEPFSQDSLSALFYIRTLPLTPGSVVTFPVVSEGKGWEAVCTVVRRETVSSPFGKVQAIVIKPETKYQGVLKKNGDSFLWLTDDDRRIPLKLEAKVKIGTVVAELKRADLGTPSQKLAQPVAQSAAAPSPGPSPVASVIPTISVPGSLPGSEPGRK